MSGHKEGRSNQSETEANRVIELFAVGGVHTSGRPVGGGVGGTWSGSGSAFLLTNCRGYRIWGEWRAHVNQSARQGQFGGKLENRATRARFSLTICTGHQIWSRSWGRSRCGCWGELGWCGCGGVKPVSRDWGVRIDRCAKWEQFWGKPENRATGA